MAAGLGFIEFTTGDVLSAAAANGYLASQTVMVFADAAARTSAITSPQEGMFSFLKDTNATQFYDGAAWVNLDTTGMVNPMTTTGDVIYSSSGTTPARLGIGTAGQVLTVNSGATAPEWASPAGGGKVLQVVQATTSTSTNVTSTTFTDSTLTATITPSSATSKILVLTSQPIMTFRNFEKASSKVRLMRGATAVFTQGNTPDNGGSSSIQVSGVVTNSGYVYILSVNTIQYLDSPATTSATTYKTQIAVQDTANTGSVRAQANDSTSTITLMEIGA